MFNNETRMHDSALFRPCVLIPVYNHHQVLGQTLDRIVALGLPVVLVDDGSEASSHAVLEELVAAHDGVQMVTHPHNRPAAGL
jgi:cellulose synthase/poly-beta-1,6-N-acetylglucosamine synthase-like glycosyltransferase